MAQQLQKLFNPSKLNEIARQTGFVKRTSKFTERNFLFLFVFSNLNTNKESLSVLNSKLEAKTFVSLSNQGLNERINKTGVNYLKEIFTYLLNQKLSYMSHIQSILGDKFNSIRLLDSTIFQLPSNNIEKYKGSGGASSKSAIKIQLEYDLKTGHFMHIELCNGKDHDNNYGSKYIETVKSGDLCIRDLGYFSTKDFLEIENRGAKYISRLKLNTSLYTKDNPSKYPENGQMKKKSIYKKVDLIEIMPTLKPGETIELDDIYVGSKKEKLKTRLIIYKLTDKQLNDRLEKNFAKEKKKGITFTKKTTQLRRINVYITNIPKDAVSKECIHEIYSLRWQVEIFFKIWKSLFNINQVKPVKIERFECHLYGTLIAIVLCSLVGFQMRCLLLKKKKEISEIKTFSIIREYLDNIYQSLITSWVDCYKILRRILGIISKNGLKSRRRKKKTVFDILMVFPELDRQKKMVA